MTAEFNPPRMRRPGMLLLLLNFLAVTAYAQEQRYITDEILVPVRSGAGGEYRIVNKGLPSGTPITLFSLSEDGVWAEVETRGGTRGWLRAQYIQAELPTKILLEQGEAHYRELEADRDKLLSMLDDTQSEAYAADGELAELRERLAYQLLHHQRTLSGERVVAGRDVHAVAGGEACGELAQGLGFDAEVDLAPVGAGQVFETARQ